MIRVGLPTRGVRHWRAVLCAALVFSVGSARSAEVLLKDNRVLRGKLGEVASLADAPSPPQPDGVGPLQMILLLDDDLRRVFFSKRQIQKVGQDQGNGVDEKFTIRQRAMRSGPAVKSVGPLMRVQPFDEFGRRIYSFNTAKGQVDVIQGITELTPQWAKVEGISHIWDMRIAPSSIPHDVLHKILMKQIDVNNVEHHKKIARYYLQSERYDEAREQLEFILKKFASPELKEQLAPSIASLRRISAQRLLDELNLRRQAGQDRLVREKLKIFPTEEVPGELLQAVRAMEEEYTLYDTRRAETLKMFDAEVEKITDTGQRSKIEEIRKEIDGELNPRTMDRLVAFRQSVDDKGLQPAEKVSLAISGWLLGADNAVVRLPMAISALTVRGLLRDYINEKTKVERDRIFSSFQSEEASAPATVAAILANMKPPGELPPPIDEAKPGYFEGSVPSVAKEPAVGYRVQLPPEYDPYRRYPTIVTLNGTGTTPDQQIDWWAGPWTADGWRAGQASRQGYIVIAPDWTLDHQKQYAFSQREHAAVLNVLRDAMQRYAIDADRVYLSGHSMGGDAAWDLGLAHPDLWAGVIPVVATADKYVALYAENGRRVPFYFVGGELDGGKLAKNARDLDRYLKGGYNVTVVEYLGRGHEHFYDEILRLFDWMGRQKREFFPKEFKAVTMRPWDNVFWWIELSGLPPASMVAPEDWPPRSAQPVKIECKLTDNNSINVVTGSARAIVWISPKMVNLQERVNVLVNGNRANSGDRFVQADLRTLLDDVRARGDRQNPFWAKVEMTTGRLKGR